MPFNKGDFTQQGVAGHVNANLRLNEKRLVNIDMTSNENAEGCTIAGTVTDLLNDEVYNIGSAPSGNIEITENGENINVAPYATATVSVAGEIPFIIPLQTVTTLSSGYRELPLGVNLGDLSLGDYVVLKMNGAYYGMPVSGYLIGTVTDLTPDQESITFAGNFVVNDTPTTVQVDVLNTPLDAETWGILLLINNTQTAMADLEISAVAW